MREIKFRAFSKTTNKMSIPFGLYESPRFHSEYKGKYCTAGVVPSRFLYETESETKHFYIMQYTGLKDKNGVEIYEGDILQYKHYYAPIKWWSTVSEIAEINANTEKQRQDFHIDKDIVVFRDSAFCKGYKELSSFDIRDGKITQKLITGKTNWGDFEERYWDFEVIGNIYENPNWDKQDT